MVASSDSRRDTGPLRRLATYASLANALILIGVKLAAWFATGSLALLASVVDGGVDLGAAAATWFGVRYAQQAPDREHRFGHDKAESLAAALQSVFLAGSACVLIAEAVAHLISPVPVTHLELGLVVTAASLAATIGLVLFQSYVVRRTGSAAVAADRMHYQADVVMNVAVIVSLALARVTGWTRSDPAFALAIALYMLWSAAHVARRAVRVLLDHELPDEDRQRIKAIVLQDGRAKAMHDLRTRSSGDRIFIEFHLEMDPEITVREGHDIADDAERALREAYPNADVMAHQEPAGIQDRRLDDLVHRAG